MVLDHAEAAGNDQIYSSDQTPPGESNPMKTTGLNHGPVKERKPPNQPTYRQQQPRQEAANQSAASGSEPWPDWDPKWNVPGWNLWTDGDQEKWSQSSGAAPSAQAAPVEVKKEGWDDGYSDYYNKNYNKDYHNKGADWKKDEEMKPVPSKRELAPPPPPRPAPPQSQPPLPAGPRPATVQPQPKVCQRLGKS